MNESASFPAASTSPKLARSFVSDALRGADPEILQSVVLMVSELASNAVKHAMTSFTVSIDQAAGSIVVAVTDGGPGRPTPRRPAAQESSGRGLLLVEELSDEWGVDDHPTGKSVWARIVIDPEERRRLGLTATQMSDAEAPARASSR